MMVLKLDRVANFLKLTKEVVDLCKKINPETNQISCQTLDPAVDDWGTSNGRIDELPEKNEELYCHVNPSLKDTELEKLIKRYNGFRTRIMVLDSRKCYSVHSDPTPRIHIPIETNDQCWMVWPDDSECYQLPLGSAYWTDTRKNHTFLNGSTKTRIHIVMGILE